MSCAAMRPCKTRECPQDASRARSTGGVRADVVEGDAHDLRSERAESSESGRAGCLATRGEGGLDDAKAQMCCQSGCGKS